MPKSYQKLGELLKSRRHEMNLSLKDIEMATSIRRNYLQSIEDGAVDKLIAPVYAQGFIKQYAVYLDIDGDQLLKEYEHLFKASSNNIQIDQARDDVMQNLSDLEVRGNQGRHVRWAPNLVWIIVAAGIAAATWFLAKSFGIL